MDRKEARLSGALKAIEAALAFVIARQLASEGRSADEAVAAVTGLARSFDDGNAAMLESDPFASDFIEAAEDHLAEIARRVGHHLRP